MKLSVRKLMSILLAALLLVGLVPAEAFAMGGRLITAFAMADSGGGRAPTDEGTKDVLSGYVYVNQLHEGDIIGPNVNDLQGDGTFILLAEWYEKEGAGQLAVGHSDVQVVDWSFRVRNNRACFKNYGDGRYYYPYAGGSVDSWIVVSAENGTYVLTGYGTAQNDEPFMNNVTYRHYDADGTLLPDATLIAMEGFEVGEGTVKWADGRTYVVREDVTISKRVEVNGTVNLILLDSATLNAVRGISVNQGNTLNIFVGSVSGTIEGTGALIADARDSGGENAGIGGDSYTAGGALNIHGGNISAYGNVCGASIGGGNNRSHDVIRIYDGTVNAYGGSNTTWGAAGIGGGFGAAGGTVYIYGGTVNATGTGKSAGIGGGGSSGNGGAGGNVYVYGGTVTATGASGAMGIGAAQGNSNNGTLTVGTGVNIYTSTDNSTWTNTTSDTSVRTRYMRVEKPAVHEHNGITFQPWDNGASLPTSGSWYLTTDVTLSGSFNVNAAELSLCLNGHTVTQSVSGMNVYYIRNGGTLNLYDEDGDCGVITGGHNDFIGGAVTVNNAAFNMYGGTISGNVSETNGGGVGVTNNGVFNMYGGVITGNTANTSAGATGGGVVIQRSTFNMYGGVISGNTGANGGGIGVIPLNGTPSTATIYGGTVTGNYGYFGGGIIVSSSTLNLVGGTVSGNYADASVRPDYNAYGLEGGAGVFSYGSSTVNLSGTAFGADDTISATHVITIADDLGDRVYPVSLIAASDNAPITGVITSGLSGHGTADNFVSGDSAYAVVLDSSGEASLTDEHIHDGMTFEPWNSTTGLPTTAGNYYLTGDVTISSAWNAPSGTNLCLNGYGIRASGNTSVIRLASNATLHIFDCNPTREHYITLSNYRGTAVSDTGTETEITNGSGVIKVLGGYITGGSYSSGGGGIYCGSTSAGSYQLYIKGVTLIGNKANGASSYGQGGAICAYNGGTVDLDSTRIIYNFSQRDGGANAYALCRWGGTTRLNNVTIEYNSGGGACLGNGTVLSGDTVIRNNIQTAANPAEYNLGGGNYYNASGLTEGAYISLRSGGNRRITSTNDAANYIQYFHVDAPISQYQIAVDAEGYGIIGLPRALTYDANGGTGDMTASNGSYTHGLTATVAGCIFTRPEYFFIGWNTAEDGSGTSYAPGDTFVITADTTLYAQWSNLYTVTWANWDGTVLETDLDVLYGTMPEYNGAAPTRPEDSDYIYDFAGWTPEVAAVTGDVTYTASFNAVDKGEYVLYYTLDSDLDDDIDLFHDYQAGADVTVSVWLMPPANGMLQAFDLLVRNDANLARMNVNFQYGQLLTEGSGHSTETLTRIIVIGDDPNSIIEIHMTAGEPVLLGTITYRIGEGVIYGQQLPITILTSSNIAVSGTPESFSPAVRGNILGAEITQTYTVSYNDNVDGVDIPVPADQTKLHGIDLTLSQTYPVRDGYSFVGWAINADSETADYAPGDAFSIDADTTLYALWERTVFTVRWINGNTVLETNSFPKGSIPVYNGPEPTKPSTVLYTYTFVGWNTDPNADAPLAVLPNVTDDIDFYAVFEQHIRLYTVTWMTQDGTQILAVTEHPYGETPEYPNTLPDPTKPMDAMYTYTFDGWSEDMNQEHGEPLPSVRGDMTLYAAFTPVPRTYTATLMGNGGSPETQIIDVVYGEPSITLPENVTRPGYTFAGWNTEPDGSGTTVTEVENLTENVTYYAQWTPIVYTLHYDANGGSGSVPDVTFTYEDIVEILGKDAFTKPGAEFKLTGWNTQADGQGYSVLASSTQEGSYLAGLGVDGNNVLTLYAQWTDKEYIIEYDLVGGTLLGNNPNGYTHSDVYAVAVPYVPTRDGFAFDGWLVTSDEQNSVTLEYYDGSWWIPAGTVGNLFFTAKWTAEVYDITFTDNGTVLRAAAYVTTTMYLLSDMYVAQKDGYTFIGWRVIAGEGSWELGAIKPYDFSLYGSWGNVTLEAIWEVNEYTIMFFDGIDQLGTARYTVESTDTLGQLLGFVPTKNGYVFSGWLFENESIGGWIQNTVYDNDQSVAGMFGNINLYVQWSKLDYTITFVHSDRVLGSAVYTIETNRTIGELRNFELPERLGYTFAGWQVETAVGSWLVQTYDEAYSLLGSFGDVTLYTTWTLNDYTITFHNENGDEIEVVLFNVETESIAEPAVPEMTAYTGVWGPYYLNLPQDQDVYPVYTPIEYTITFDVDGGTPIDPMTYTIESTDVLPEAFKGLFSFVNWTVVALGQSEGNNWELGLAINAGTLLTGRYGDVILLANWSFEDNVRYSIEEYKYAPTGYVMLLIADDLASGQIYTFGGEAMYYTTDANYLLDPADTGVFYTLIPYDGNVNMSNMSKLTEAGALLVGIADAAERVTVTYDGNINMLDDVVNIADANAVFQMIAQPTIGGYYSLDQLSIEKRLGADMVKESYNSDHRGSIEDVHAIVEIVRNSIGE